MRALPLFATALALGLAAGPVADARACGAFFAPKGPTTAEMKASLPRLAIEQVVLIYDDQTHTEHLIRELRFDGADQSFGFVIPVPSRPTIAPVATPPFEKLLKDFSFEGPQPAVSRPRRSGKGGPPGGAAEGAAHAPPVVLEKRRIGKLTAFVLEASDATGLDTWLKKNGFSTTPESSTWLDRQVKQGFHFVALRYDAPARGTKGGMTSETLRISFQTPEPYYPYLEPDHADDPADRMLLLWYIAQQPRVPVSAVSLAPPDTATTTWKRPWAEGESYPQDKRLNADLGSLAALLPTGGVSTIQTFRDRKSSRRGWGDVLLLSRATRSASDPDFLASHRSFLSILDPALAPVPFGAISAPAGTTSAAPPGTSLALPSGASSTTPPGASSDPLPFAPMPSDAAATPPTAPVPPSAPPPRSPPVPATGGAVR